MSLVQVSPESDEWEIAFFHDIQSKIMMRLDEIEPGYVTRIYEDVGEDGLISLFKESCRKEGFEISKDNNNSYWLIKTPSADLASVNIHSLVTQYSSVQNISSEEMHSQNKETGKSHFSVLANNFLKSCGAKLISGKIGGDSTWKFDDESQLSIEKSKIKSWSKSPEINESDFEIFIASYRNLLDKEMSAEYVTSHEMSQ